jgi:hypothetical protein
VPTRSSRRWNDLQRIPPLTPGASSPSGVVASLAPTLVVWAEKQLPVADGCDVQRLVEHERAAIRQRVQMHDMASIDAAAYEPTRRSKQLQFDTCAGRHPGGRFQERAAAPDVDDEDFLSGPKYCDVTPLRELRVQARCATPLWCIQS